jgi:hypothetical protein
MAVSLSVVVVAYDMRRELPRTLQSLAPAYQRGIGMSDYEVIVVDNGSPQPIGEGLLSSFSGTIRTARLEDGPPSPARAANLGVAMAAGRLVGLMVDGARMASPGLLATAALGARLAERPIVATLAWHLGPGTHMDAVSAGYGQDEEDRLLATSGWEEDGYRLFEIASLSGSSRRGWFGPLGESNALFLPRELWTEVGGMDERFSLPGGGLVNHDLLARACALPQTRLVTLLGEGTFHQLHGGASTSRRVTRDEAFADYEMHRGHPYQPPGNEAMYVGRLPESALVHFDQSVRWALRARNCRRR